MSVLITGMDMPKSCIECRLLGQDACSDELYCSANGRGFTWENLAAERVDTCPLIEIPSLGRLIDVDKFIAKVDEHLRQKLPRLAEMFGPEASKSYETGAFVAQQIADGMGAYIEIKTAKESEG